MFYDAEQDPLCYPGTSVLINKAGLQDQRELDEFEFSMFLSRAEEPLPGGVLDYPHYRSIHRHLFQDVYDWAGEPRTIRIGKGGNWFCFPENLAHHMTVTFGALAKAQYLANLPAAAFAVGAAKTLSEINAGHPFREGNGRAQLAFLRLLVLNAQLPFDDEALDPDQTLRAMVSSFAGDLAPLEALVTRIVR
ncbi:MAG: Fic family protein [Devosia sp.]